MLNKAFYYISGETNPYNNLALEEYLLRTLKRGECVFYLWQNSNTVVIGRNQNYIKECNTELLFSSGGKLARRLSGGGAVYHDMGNLNFTFLFNRDEYSVPRQLGVITRALGQFGVHAELTGRNDIAVKGRKISGNAFYESGERCFHHGTILIDANTDKMSEVLRVSPEKLTLKGVDSVRSRVVNLSELNPEITPKSLISPLIDSFGATYALTPVMLPSINTSDRELARLQAKYSSEAWIFNKTLPGARKFSARTEHGEIEVLTELTDGVISDARIFTDSLETEAFIELCEMMKGLPLSKEAFASSLPPSRYRDDIMAIIFDKG